MSEGLLLGKLGSLSKEISVLWAGYDVEFLKEMCPAEEQGHINSATFMALDMETRRGNAVGVAGQALRSIRLYAVFYLGSSTCVVSD